MHVITAPSSSDRADGSINYSNKILVFETVVDGGFGKMLELGEGATLELGEFERHPSGVPTHADDLNVAVDKMTNVTLAPSASTDDAPRPHHRSRLFNNFHFRKRNQDRVAGPALAVVDAESTITPPNEGKDKESKVEDMEEGVKVTIRLVALDEQGKALSSPNEQGTYLHVVRLGATPADGEEDARPWVVKVVKREATIGPHTFHLHEIYGLSCQSSVTTQPTASPLPTTAGSPTTTEADGHTYPPTTTAPPVREDEPSSECLLCLSSPREIVLLPCRHLVACKECAINMVEFGAGGQITQPEEAAPAVEGEQATGSEAATTTPPPVTTGQNGRRKRRAKGWFCPVCRQRTCFLLF